MDADRKRFTIHKRDLLVNKEKIKKLLDEKGMEYSELHKKAEDRYGLDITYKAYMNLLSNRSTWKLVYAWATAEILDVDIKDIFDIVDVDVDKVVEERKKWEEKYYTKN